MALDFIAGCLGGCAGIAIGHPFDTIKVKLQTQDYKNPVYRGTWDCFTKVLQSESLGGMYRGVWSPMCGVALVNAVVFGVYGHMQRSLSDRDSLQSHFLSGATAGLAQSVVSGPVELIKTRMQTNPSYGGTMNCFTHILGQEGVPGMFKGLTITAAREFLGYGLYFATYEVLTRSSPETPIGTATMLLAGGVAGTVSWVLTYPLDVVKTRYQADTGRYSGLVDCLGQSVRSEGVSCLGRGLMPTIIRAFPTNAVTFTVVTWVMRFANLDTSVNVTKILDSVAEEKHIIGRNGMVETVNIECNWLLRMNAQRYFLMSEDLWVDGGNDDDGLLNNRNFEADEYKVENDLLAAESKLIDNFTREFNESDYDDYLTKYEQAKGEYKSNKR